MLQGTATSKKYTKPDEKIISTIQIRLNDPSGGYGSATLVEVIHQGQGLEQHLQPYDKMPLLFS